MNLNVNGILPQADEDDEYIYIQGLAPITMINEIHRLSSLKIQREWDERFSLQKTARQILLQLAKRDGVTQLDLVKSTHLKAPTISVILHKLENDGYVIRKSDNYDLRAVRVYLTDKGREFNSFIIKKMMHNEKNAMRNLTESEYGLLTKLLSKVQDALEEDIKKI